MPHILIIDDNAVMAETLKVTLEQSGHFVATAGNGAQGLRLIRSTHFDLVLTDLVMPEKEGIETIMELHRSHPEIKIIAMSGGPDLRSTSNNLRAASYLGATVSLLKPFTHDELSVAIERVLTGSPAPG